MKISAASLIFLLLAVSASASTGCAAKRPAALPPPVVTHGNATTRSGEVKQFRAEVGLLRVKGGGVPYGKSVYSVPALEEGTPPTATMSYYAYSVIEPVHTQDRPILFIWDGGPGASTRPMLLNSFGPIILNTPSNGQQETPSTSVRNNPDTLLDVADLVFIDAPGTGFGHLEGCNAARGFFGIDVDAAAFQRFIQRYLRITHREHSPVILMGESYGTVRAAVVAKRLQDSGTPVSGVVLISQFLSLDAWSDGSKANIGTENAFFLTLPTFAATAWVHNKVPHTGELGPWLKEVESFSLGTYAPALLQGANLSIKERQELADRLASYTGLTAKTWLNEDLRIEGSRFRNLLEANEGKIVGREDTRNEGPTPRVRGTAVEDDPRPVALQNLGRDAFKTYVRGTLGAGQRPFRPYIDGPDTRWDMHHLTDPGAWPDTYANVAPDLVAAMTANPSLHTLIFGGYFDLAAPYFGAPYLISQLPFSIDAKSRIVCKIYPAPHDVYAAEEARHDIHDRIAALAYSTER